MIKWIEGNSIIKEILIQKPNLSTYPLKEKDVTEIIYEIRTNFPDNKQRAEAIEIVVDHHKTTKEIHITQSYMESIYKNYIICNAEEIKECNEKYKYDKNNKLEGIDYKYTRILDASFELLRIYEIQSGERLYEVKINNETIQLNKKDLLNFIEKERNYSFVSGKKLRDIINPVINEYEKLKDIHPQKMFSSIGVFKDNEDELIAVYPTLNLKLFGENDYQKEIIENCTRREIDVNGEKLEVLHEIIHLSTLPKDIRLITCAHALISPFFYVLKDFLDIFPKLYWLVPVTGVGKSKWLSLLFNYLYGTELLNADDINSLARLTLFFTGHTPALYFDDISGFPDDGLSYLLAIGTAMGSRKRMTPDQKFTTSDVLSTYTASGNSDIFLQGENKKAERVRSIILRDFKNINPSNEESKRFEELSMILKNDTILGYFLLNEVISFLKDEYPDLPSFIALKKLINEGKKNVLKLFDMYKVKLSDPRRTTIYTLIAISLKIWGFIFEKKGLESKLFKDTISSGLKFVNLVRKIEGIETSLSVQTFENILQFYEEGINNSNSFKRYYHINSKKEERILLGTDFINAYDKWAKIHGYEIMKSLSKLANKQSILLGLKIDAKTYTSVYDADNDVKCDGSIRGVHFYKEEIELQMGIETDEFEDLEEEELITEEDITNE